jgi:hypothetical protein
MYSDVRKVGLSATLVKVHVKSPMLYWRTTINGSGGCVYGNARVAPAGKKFDVTAMICNNG